MIPSRDVMLPLLNDGDREIFASPDNFFKEFYRFYCNKGIMPTVLSEICSVLSLGFSIGFSVYLFEFIDWNAVVQCSDEESCHALNEQFISNPFHHTPKFTSFLIALYFLLFLSVWLWRVWGAAKVIEQSIAMSNFYRDKLNISDSELENLEWPVVIERLIFSHRAGNVQILPKPDMTVNDVVLRIMRSENYLIALINRNCLHMFLPWWLSPFFTESLLFTTSMEWSISYCVLAHLFDDEYRLSPEFLDDVDSMKFRFQIVGLIQLIMLPFTLIFVVVYFLMENFQQFHSNRAYLGPRQWTPLARWEFREFNELPHLFEKRLNQAYEPAMNYLNSFVNIYVSIVAEFVTFVSGSILAVLIIVSFISEGALLYIHIADRNLLWYLGVFSACFAASRACIPDATKVKKVPAELLAHASAMTHHFPPHWQSQEHCKSVRDEVAYLLQYKIVIFLYEILGVLLTPVILVFSLPSSAATIVEFVKKHTRIVDGIGAVCDYSLLELEKYGDNKFGSVPSTAQALAAEKLNFGKLEKSFLNFKQTYSTLVQDKDKVSPPFQDTLSCFKEIKREHQRNNLLASIVELQRDSSFPEQDDANDSAENHNQTTVNSDDSNSTRKQQYHTNPNQPGQIPGNTAHGRHPAFARSDMVTSTFYNDSAEQKSGESGVEMGYQQLHSPELRSVPFPRFDGQPATVNTASSSLPYRSGIYRNPASDLFTSTIPGLGGDGLSNSADLPDVLRSVLREQNIDFRNDFYWLNRFHSENRQNPAEMERSLLQFRQHQQLMRSNRRQGSVPELRLPGSLIRVMTTDNATIPTSPLYPGFHLSGVQTGDEEVRSNIFMPPTWNSPSTGAANFSPEHQPKHR